MTPGIWGFEMSPALTVIYVGLVCGSALLFALRRHIGAALGILFTGLLLYTGFLGMPWLPLIAGLTVVAWWLGGMQLAAITLCGLMTIAVGGVWQSTMFSAYLMAAAIITSILFGGLIGVLAAEYDAVSRVMRPVNDFLQTIPPFVILIPLIMFFQVGDFSSYLAIIAYAIVPMIRYTEKGLRHVPVTQIEAGQLAGCTPLQLLFFVKFPAARTDLILGLNQTIMSALAMLAVAALVGSRGLGQDVYIALSKADPGLGLLAGLSIAILATITDRFMRRVAA
jgi:glycine betaine/proline transport system permease protein